MPSTIARLVSKSRILLWLLFLWGAAVYAITRRTPIASYWAMRHLHGLSDGRFNDRFLWLAHRLRPAAPPATVSGCLGRWTTDDFHAVAAALREDGIVVLDRTLPPEICDRLEQHARTTPCRPMGVCTKVLYSSSSRRALRYDYEQADILIAPDARALSFDGTFAAIATSYFGCAPVFDFTAMWWTTPHGDKDFAKAAQMFHYDMDRLFFLKFFVYLSDVTEHTGPHVFVAGSHRRKPPDLREPRRFSDADVERAFEPAQIRHVIGKRGTVFAADTRGIHKGMPVIEGERLVLQVEFAISLFGQNY